MSTPVKIRVKGFRKRLFLSQKGFKSCYQEREQMYCISEICWKVYGDKLLSLAVSETRLCGDKQSSDSPLWWL